ncbi:hypothetical protein ACFWB2_33795 [Streptomyces virginiae]|uniref:hypothetical protein n=1 Tax=Streptomyces virginiae TaxID=1961 RepID=UPI0036CC38B4
MPAVFAAAAISVFGMTAPASASDGWCHDTDFCAFKNGGRNYDTGYYDLDTPDRNFSDNYFYNDGSTLNDSISSYTAGTGTSCAGYSLFWDKDFKGPRWNIPKGWGGDIAGAYFMNNDEWSSYTKYGC